MTWHCRIRRFAIGLGVVGACAMRVGGCSQYADRFRAAASPSLQTGVSALLDGLVEGVFAVVEPEGATADDGSTNGGTGT